MKEVWSCIIILLIVSTSLVAQQAIQFDTTSCEKAVYNEGGIEFLLSNAAEYPKEEVISKIAGDVILSCILTKDGQINSFEIIESPSQGLSLSALKAVDGLNGEWNPSTINGIAIDRKYFFVFRYRIYEGTVPSNITEANKAIEKQNFKRALKFYDKEINDNEFRSSHYVMRAAIYKQLGDLEASYKDMKYSIILENNILAVVDVIALGISRSPSRM